MRKALFGFVAGGVAIGLRPVVRRIGLRMREHCEKTMATQLGGLGEAGEKMRECCEGMTAGQRTGHRETVGTT